MGDGVEVGRTLSPDAQCAGRFTGDADPTTRTNPTNPDHDGDGAPDGTEDTNGNGRVDDGETNPLSPDSDGDQFCDGPADVAGVCTGNDDPVAYADSDGDGVPDRLDAAPGDPDADDDGLCDGGNAVADVCVAGEDTDNDGRVDPGESDPARIDSDCDGLADVDERAAGTDASVADTDGDGLLDGVERGSAGSGDPSCPGAGADAAPSSTTDPLVADSDSDGLLDGTEDADGDGAIDDGELDPLDPTDGAEPVVQQACSAAGLRPLRAIVAPEADVQIVVDGRAGRFGEHGSIRAQNAEQGVFGYDAPRQVGFVAVARPPAGGDALVDEAAVRDLIAITGGLTQPISQTLTTWDGFPAVTARYDQPGPARLKERLNAIAAALAPGIEPPLDPASDVDVVDLRIEVAVVRRSAEQTVVIVGALPLALSGGDGVFTLRDLVDGSALGRARDTRGVYCERRSSAGFSKLEILWAVDNSTSMGDEQTAVAAAAQAFVDKLSNSTLDWRAAVLTSSFYSPRTTQDAACTNAVCEARTTSQCRTFTRDLSTLQSAFGEMGPAWVGAGGACNQSREQIVHGAQLMLGFDDPGTREDDGVARFVPASAVDEPGRLRAGADVLVILLGDADDQRFEDRDAASGIDTYEQFFRALPQRVTIGGILCPEDQDCGEGQRSPRVARGLVNRLGGVVGSINDPASIAATVDAIVDAAIADASPYVLARDAISASVKVSMTDGATLGPCNTADVPRSRANGFDYDARTRTASFFGDCRPVVDGALIAVSYRTWQRVPLVINEPCECTCGGGFACLDDGGDQCSCLCRADLTCAPGFAFSRDSCSCVCDSGSAQCDPTRIPADDSCVCLCRDDCGGCGPAQQCNTSLCACTGGVEG
ncbi:MAG: hypothetical protein FJ137_05415 [Deltaproteobacteria bacterium]|nr:hypothetical protein [Deltaproteobacteria bacterium]